MPRHYSTWDEIAVIYWPRSRHVDLRIIGERMKLSRAARDAHTREVTERRWWPWIVSYVVAFAVIIWLVGTVAPSQQTTRHRAISTFAALLITTSMWSLARYARQSSIANYMAARRLREHRLTRMAPAEFAAQLPVATAPSELDDRRTDTTALLTTLPSIRSLAVSTLDHLPARVVLLVLLPAWTAIQIGMAWTTSNALDAFLPNLLLVALASLLVLSAWRLFELRRRARRALRRSACPDCGYSLTGVPPTPSPFQPCLNLGPKRCPECASPWPLIPLTLDQRPLNATASPLAS